MGMILIAIGAWLGYCGKKRWSVGILAASILWFWTWSTGCTTHYLTSYLEKDYPPVTVEALPEADVIVVLGGGMHANKNDMVYPDIAMSGDRAWHTARIWKAGKAPIIVTSGSDDRASTVPFLRDLGVDDDAIICEDDSRNTEENARLVMRLMEERKVEKPKVLLVTSAWHMRRSIYMFKKYAPGIEVVPAACDYDMDKIRPWPRVALLPVGDYLNRNTMLSKEIIGYWGYRLRR